MCICGPMCVLRPSKQQNSSFTCLLDNLKALTIKSSFKKFKILYNRLSIRLRKSIRSDKFVLACTNIIPLLIDSIHLINRKSELTSNKSNLILFLRCLNASLSIFQYIFKSIFVL